MSKFEAWALVVMVASAAAGTIWLIALDLQTRGSIAAVGWPLIAVVWFIVLRRLVHFWRRR